MSPKKWTIFILVLVPLAILGFGQKEFVYPLFLELKLDHSYEFSSEHVALIEDENYIEPIQIDLLSVENEPKCYVSSFLTTVCEDEICEVLHIKMFWDLAGEYVGYDTISGHPLTKFDHEPFKTSDYTKLHELLLNEGTILKFKRKDELIDKKVLLASDVIDGTTGATALEIKEEVVDGALYTSYTLWHIAHSGEIENTLKAKTRTRFNSEIAEKFLQSDKDNYRIFAIDEISDTDLVQYQWLLIDLIETGSPLLRKKVLRKSAELIELNADYQLNICQLFDVLDINTRSYFLTILKERKQISIKSLEELSKYLTVMSKNQLKDFLLLVSSIGYPNQILIENLSKAASGNFRYDYVIKESGIMD
ncbi:hypothetical protein [Echinicola sp. 20G]|uniref:hypothetical protein n=1 Tax=Echinicola sp. 20G TaxID=2781961 RepID=UPI0019102294|nr:hypothetical protein [Echinicola sp. 20G]